MTRGLKWGCLLSAALLFACGGRNRPEESDSTQTETASPTRQETVVPVPEPSRTARRLDSLGYVNVVSLDSTIAVQLAYATADNFTGEVLYDNLTEAYLLPEAAEKLVQAHRWLREQRPGCRFIVYDAARPMEVQRRMWQVAVRQGKSYYVANPARGGGLHNYGAAVDLSILDERGAPLPMGTGYDHLGPESNTDRESALVSAGKLTPAELENRLLLRRAMRSAGFRTVTSEWWHFNLCSRAEAIQRYEVIEF
jgi:D-alanyl-D-alanine dipeptidase